MTQRSVLAIATTGGPSIIRAMSFEPQARLSQMLRYRQSHIPLGVKHFAAFDERLRQHLRGLGVPLPDAPVHLEIEGDIDTGSSWQLGHAAAHVLHACDRLVCEGDPDEAGAGRLYVTGEIEVAVGDRHASWRVLPVAGVPEKIETGRRFLTGGPAGATMLLPEGNGAEAEGMPPGVTAVPIADLRALVETLAPELLPRAKPRRGGRGRPPPRRRNPWLRRAALLGGLGLAAAVAARTLAPLDGETGNGEQTTTVTPLPEPRPTPTTNGNDTATGDPQHGTTTDGEETLTAASGPAAELFRMTHAEGCAFVRRARDFGNRGIAYRLEPVAPDSAEIAGSFNRPLCGIEVRPSGAGSVEVRLEPDSPLARVTRDAGTGTVSVEFAEGLRGRTIGAEIRVDGPDDAADEVLRLKLRP